MSCCFSPPKDKYEFSGDQVASKNKKNKNKKNKAAKNGQAKPRNTEKPNEEQEDKNPEVAILLNGEPLDENADTPKDEPEVIEDVAENRKDKSDDTSSQDGDNETGNDKRNSKEPAENELDIGDTSSKRNSTLSSKSEDRRTSKEIKEENTIEEPTNNNDDKKKGEVFVIALDKRNSFYGSVFQKQQDEKKREEEKKQKELEMKEKLAALKAANAPKSATGDVSEKMEGDRTAEEPAPDYSDDEETDKKEDYVELRKTVKNRISAMLTREEWDQILDRAGLDDLEGTEKGQETGVEIPEPDYDGAQQTRPLGRSHTFNIGGAGPDGKKSKSPETKARQELHREMMLNQKFGIDVLNKKTELQREFTKRKEKEKMKDKELPRQNSFETKLQEIKMKMQKHEGNGEIAEENEQPPDDPAQPEFMRVYSKINRTKPASTSS